MFNHNPLVSIIVTTYNRSHILLETVHSILKQTYSNFELLIIDDNSTDHTNKVISLIDDERIKYYCLNECSGGPAIPRNFGINIASGIYIAFCDDDDIWKTNKLEVQLNFLLENNYDLVSSNMDCFEDNISNIIFSSKNRMVLNIYDLILTNQINTSTVLLKKTENLEFNESKIFLTNGEDYLLWLKLYKKKYKFGFIKESLVYYRIWDENISSRNISSLNLKKIRLKLLFSKEYPEFFIIFFCYISIIINLSKYLLKKIIYKR